MDLINDALKDGILEVVLKEIAAEVLIFHADSLQILYANSAALNNLQLTRNASIEHSLPECLSQDDTESLGILLGSLRNGKKNLVTLSARCRRQDQSLYPVEARVVIPPGHDKKIMIWIAHDQTESEKHPHAPTPAPMDLRAIVTHIPAMTYQILRKRDGRTLLRYVSAQSNQLLGVDADVLRASPEYFLKLIIEEDKPDYLTRMAEAGGGHLSFNWEGRISMKAWKDVKWVSVRVSKRKTREGTLYDGIVLNITHSKLAEAELRHSKTQLSALAAHMESLKETERLNLAREVHDDLGGNLTAIKIGLSWLKQHLPASETRLHERTAYLDNVVDQTIEATHRIASSLRPPVLDFGIVAAIDWQMQRFSQNTDIACQFHAPQEEIPIDPEAAITVFRIAQEALTNVAKHARATTVVIHLKISEDSLVLTISDNGVGLKPRKNMRNGDGFGIPGMTERATVLGGELALHASTLGGTEVSLRIPLHAAVSPLSK